VRCVRLPSQSEGLCRALRRRAGGSRPPARNPLFIPTHGGVALSTSVLVLASDRECTYGAGGQGRPAITDCLPTLTTRSKLEMRSQVDKGQFAAIGPSWANSVQLAQTFVVHDAGEQDASVVQRLPCHKGSLTS
jgi:hypothetical protein